MEAEKQDQIRSNECSVERTPYRLTRLRSRAAREHHKQAVVLSAVMPGAPGQIDGEDPRQNSNPGMRQHQRQYDQRRDVHGEDSVFVKVFFAMVGAIDRRHVVRVVEKQRQRVKGNRPGTGARSNREVRDQQQRSRPCPASNDQIEPRTINPRRCRSSSLARIGRMCGHHYLVV